MPVKLSFMDDHFVGAQINSAFSLGLIPSKRSCHLSHIHYLPPTGTQCLPFEIATCTLCKHRLRSNASAADDAQPCSVPNSEAPPSSAGIVGRGANAKLHNNCDLSISMRQKERLFPPRCWVVISPAHCG
jgi:hypothetical protein